MMDFIDFNRHIAKIKINEYGGSEKKKTVILDDGNKYLLKFPDPTREVKREISYINNAISEYLGCHVFQQAGFQAQDTILGIYTDANGHQKIACACKDIRNAGETLYEVEKLELGSIDNISKLTFASIGYTIAATDGLDTEATMKEYYDRFIIDAFIGNTDRHNGNWGIIEDEAGGLRIAPVYDCGSSLSPLYADNELTDKVILNESQNVKSVICDEQGNRLHYRDFLLSGQNEDINRSIKKVIPRISIPNVKNMINKIPYISDIRKSFYNRILEERYEKVLIPSLEKSLGIIKSDEYKQWNSTVINNIYNMYIKPFSDMSENATGQIQQNGQKYDFIKNSGRIFFSKKEHCVGYANIEKSNLNVCKFVQSARKMGFQMNIDEMRKNVDEERRPSALELIEKAQKRYHDVKEKNSQKIHKMEEYPFDR